MSLFSRDVLISFGLTLIISGLIMYFCYMKFNALDNAISRQNVVLTNLLSNMKHDVNYVGGNDNMATNDAIQAAMEFNASNFEESNKIPVSDDDDESDDETSDDDDDDDNDSENDSDKEENSFNNNNNGNSLEKQDDSKKILINNLEINHMSTVDAEKTDELLNNETLHDDDDNESLGDDDSLDDEDDDSSDDADETLDEKKNDIEELSQIDLDTTDVKNINDSKSNEDILKYLSNDIVDEIKTNLEVNEIKLSDIDNLNVLKIEDDDHKNILNTGDIHNLQDSLIDIQHELHELNVEMKDIHHDLEIHDSKISDNVDDEIKKMTVKELKQQVRKKSLASAGDIKIMKKTELLNLLNKSKVISN